MLFNFYKVTEQGEEFYFGGTLRELTKKMSDDIRNGNRPELVARTWHAIEDEDDG